uniref:Uncharacterized protein n=1 Tax=Lygus hesperus TaxID=30085 RepID=A0A146MBJ0_LYGHE
MSLVVNVTKNKKGLHIHGHETLMRNTQERFKGMTIIATLLLMKKTIALTSSIIENVEVNDKVNLKEQKDNIMTIGMINVMKSIVTRINWTAKAGLVVLVRVPMCETNTETAHPCDVITREVKEMMQISVLELTATATTKTTTPTLTVIRTMVKYEQTTTCQAT